MTSDKLELSLCDERIDQNVFCISNRLHFKNKKKYGNQRTRSSFSAFTEFFVRNARHRDMRSAFPQLAFHQPETNFLTLRAQRSFAVQAEDIQVL